jgi:hypothetical protein
MDMVRSNKILAALFFSFALFAFFAFLGASVVELLSPWRSALRGLLIAPGIGAATMVLPLFALNRLNFGVRQFAWPLTIALVLGAAVILWVKRPIFPGKQILPFVIVLVVAGAIAGYPLARYGFNWISYGNGDMSSYVMSAHRFADHGYYKFPDRTAMLENRDLGASYWFEYSVEGARCGSDLLLAWLISLTNLTGFQIYMPALLALHLALISAAGGLILRNSSLRTAAVASCAWLAISPLNTLGTMYQLMPQIFGVTLLAISAAILLARRRTTTPGEWIRFSLLGGGMVSALTVVYYEILPFLIVPLGCYHALQLVRRRETIKSLVAPALGIALVIAILLRTWIFAILAVLSWQAGRSFVNVDPDLSLFPYYLVPSGLANLWGFIPIGVPPVAGPGMNAAILSGGLLLLAAAAASVWQAWKGQPVAVISTVMLAVGAELYLHGGDFGLFKLSMFIQPFLLSSLVLAWLQVSRRWVHD